MSRSIPAGGQITPFEWASLSLSGPELPPPTVGGSPLTSGGHVTPCRGTCSRSAAPAPHLPVRSQRTLQWSEWSGARQFLTHLHVRQRPEAQYVPAAYQPRERPSI